MSDVEKRGSWSIYNSNGTGIPKAAEEMQFTMRFRRQPTRLVSDVGLFEIMGYLSDEFSYSSQANYDNIYNPTDLLPKRLADVIHDETQRSFATYGYATKKTWTNNTSQSLTLKWRTVSNSPLQHGYVKSETDDTYSYNPVMIAKALMSSTMPSVGPNALLNFTSITDKLGDVAKKLIGLGEKKQSNFLPFGSQPKTDTLDAAPEAVAAGSEAGNMFSNLDANLFPKHPPICSLVIGNMFRKDFMVVKNVDVTFSKEFFDVGFPLYADYTVTLESLFNSSEQSDPKYDDIFGSGLTAIYSSRVIDASTASNSGTNASTAATFSEDMMKRKSASTPQTPVTKGSAFPTSMVNPNTIFGAGTVPTAAKPIQPGLGTRLGL